MELIRANSPDPQVADILNNNAINLWTYAEISKSLSSNNRYRFYELHENGIKSFSLWLVQDNIFDLLLLCTSPGFLRQGWARKLLQACEALIQKESPEGKITLEVSSTNESAIQFYKFNGFTQIHIRPSYYKDGSDGLIFVKNLKDIP